MELPLSYPSVLTTYLRLNYIVVSNQTQYNSIQKVIPNHNSGITQLLQYHFPHTTQGQSLYTVDHDTYTIHWPYQFHVVYL